IPSDPPRLPRRTAVRRDRLPPHLEWSSPRVWDLSDASDRRRVYAIVLREGTIADIERWVDVDLLRDDWLDVALPASVRRAWEDAFARWRLECPSRDSSDG